MSSSDFIFIILIFSMSKNALFIIIYFIKAYIGLVPIIVIKNNINVTINII